MDYKKSRVGRDGGSVIRIDQGDTSAAVLELLANPDEKYTVANGVITTSVRSLARKIKLFQTRGHFVLPGNIDSHKVRTIDPTLTRINALWVVEKMCTLKQVRDNPSAFAKNYP
ncbi:MAG: hypothetical protein ACOYN2_00115 [Patescibacteria group bacterium]